MSFNLPPGVRLRDIDTATGCFPADCSRCDETFEACELNDVGLCDKCEKEEFLERFGEEENYE